MISAEMIGFKNMDPFFQYPIFSANHAGIQFFNNNSMLNSISKIDRGQYMYTGAISEWNGAPLTFHEPVPFEAYVYFSFLSYFLAFIGILLLQSFTMFVIDIFTMYRNGNFGLVFGRGEIQLTYMIFVYHWTSQVSRTPKKKKKGQNFFQRPQTRPQLHLLKFCNFFALSGTFRHKNSAD